MTDKAKPFVPADPPPARPAPSDPARAALAATLAMLREERIDAFPGAAGHAAMLAVGIALESWLVGGVDLSDDALALVRDRREWLRRSLIENERFGNAPELTSAHVADAFALSTWLLDNRDDADQRYDALARYERVLDTANGIDPATAREIRLFDVPRLRAPGRRASSDRRRLPDEPASPERHRPPDLAVDRLAHYGAEWLRDGWTIRLAGWLKVAYWDSGLVPTAVAALGRGRRALLH